MIFLEQAYGLGNLAADGVVPVNKLCLSSSSGLPVR